MLTLNIQQAPVTNTTTDALSTVTNTDTSSTIPNQVYVITQMNSNRGETNSHWLFNYFIFFDTDMRNYTFNYDTVVCETNVINPIPSQAISHSHHFTFPHDGNLRS